MKYRLDVCSLVETHEGDVWFQDIACECWHTRWNAIVSVKGGTQREARIRGSEIVKFLNDEETQFRLKLVLGDKE